MRFITFIARNLFRRRVRSVLTVLGLGIGIAAVVALMGIAWGFERSFLVIYEAKKIDLIVVRAGESNHLSSSLAASAAERLMRVPGVNGVASSLLDSVSFEDANLVSVLINGWEPGSLLFRGIRILQGRPLTAQDRRAALLGRILALNLNKKVGDTLQVAGESFNVIGIFESESLFENGGLIVPLKELQKMMGREGQVTGFVVAVDRPGDRKTIEEVRIRIEHEIPGVAAAPARDYVASDIQIRLAKAMAWATSLVALILGSIGMLNTMVMAVFERTREIGVLRALGWRRARVLALILGEAVILGLAGALVGTAFGFLGVRLLAFAPTARSFIAMNLPPEVIVVGFTLGLALSFLGGIYPALRGASLEPVEALRHE
jgi:putative ABC transport system permease protein